MLFKVLLSFAYIGICMSVQTNQTGGLNHDFGGSDQACTRTWANEALRTHFTMHLSPPTYLCKNNGGVSYRCTTCLPRMSLFTTNSNFTQGDPNIAAISTGTVRGCTATGPNGKTINVGQSKCLAYSRKDTTSGKFSCLSPSMTLLECDNNNDDAFDYISCQQCLLYTPDAYDAGGIFRSRLPRSAKPRSDST